MAKRVKKLAGTKYKDLPRRHGISGQLVYKHPDERKNMCRSRGCYNRPALTPQIFKIVRSKHLRLVRSQVRSESRILGPRSFLRTNVMWRSSHQGGYWKLPKSEPDRWDKAIIYRYTYYSMFWSTDGLGPSFDRLGTTRQALKRLTSHLSYKKWDKMDWKKRSN